MTREEAIDVLKHNYPSACYTDLCEAVGIAIKALSEYQESDPEWRRKHYEAAYAQGFVDGCKSYEKQLGQKRGQWKQGYCSECGYNWGKDAPIASVPNFCPHCGKLMKGEK